MDIVDPVGSSAATSRSLAARPASLEGVTIALLDNSKPNAKELLERLGALLAAQAGARGVRVWSKPGSSVSATAAVLEEIARSARVALTASAAGAATGGMRGAPSDLDEFQGWLMEQGWGDGLPAIPPTAERVKRMLA